MTDRTERHSKYSNKSPLGTVTAMHAAVSDSTPVKVGGMVEKKLNRYVLFIATRLSDGEVKLGGSFGAFENNKLMPV